jgi:hypothetical protein
MNASFVLMSDAFVCMKGLCDTRQVRSLVLTSDAFMRMNDAFVRTSDALVLMSDAFVLMNDAFVRTSASLVLTKGVMRVVAQGTAISFLSNKKPRRFGEAFLFLLSIFRIPSLGIKPAKYVWELAAGSGMDCERTLSYPWAGSLTNFHRGPRWVRWERQKSEVQCQTLQEHCAPCAAYSSRSCCRLWFHPWRGLSPREWCTQSGGS